MIEDGRAAPAMIGAGAAQQGAAADGRRLIGFWEFVAHRGGGRC
jgi:hypothetical protein